MRSRAEIPHRSQRESGDPRWARCGCGMACLQMILAARGDAVVPALEELGPACASYGGYVERPSGLPGPLIYSGFVDYLGAELGLAARVAAPLALGDLLAAVAGDEVVLASVSVEIRERVAAPARRGGHLVLAFEADGERVRFHDPSGEAGTWLRAAEFERFYAGRGIAVTLPRG